MIEEEYPSGRKVKSEFDANGDLQKVWGTKNQFNQVFASNFQYTAAGGISALKLGNGRWETAKFNKRLQVTELGLGGSATDTGLWKVGYKFGEINANGNVDTAKNTGNIARQTVSFDGLSQPFVQTYKYDELYRLEEAKEEVAGQSIANWKQVFTYDRYGNRLTHQKYIESNNPLTLDNTEHPSINPLDNRFSDGQGYSYDKNGNLIIDAESRGYTFNGDNKQIRVETVDAYGNPTGTIGEYFYDGDGKRVKKIADGQTTIFIYDASGKMVAEYSTNPAQTGTARVSYLTQDHLGSPRITTDIDGDVFSRRDFMPFGEEITSAHTSQRSLSLNYGEDGIKQKFTSYERDNETDLDFAQARMFNYGHGRFTTPDNFLNDTHTTDPSSWNLYIYVRNNPLRYIDPSGMIAGDFYDIEGKHIGSDGKNDGKIHIVYDKDEAKKIKKTKGDYKETVNSKVTLPSVDIVTGMMDAVKRSDAATFDKSGLTLKENQKVKKKEGFREAGISWDKDGNVTVEPDGPFNDPSVSDAGMKITSDDAVGVGHVHPSGVITTTTRVEQKDDNGILRKGTSVTDSYITNVPSPADYANAKGTNIMIGGNMNVVNKGKIKRTATFYTKSGVLFKMSYKNFKKLGAKRK